MNLDLLDHLNRAIPDRVAAELEELALSHVPNGSEVGAVTDQWAHALATDSELFVNRQISDPSTLRDVVVTRLERAKLYGSKGTFFHHIFGNTPLSPSAEPRFRFIDLFAGIGGLRLGFQKHGGVSVFSSEFDKFAQDVYKANYGEYPFGDITLVDPHDIPAHDVLLAGFPCQPFSHAGLKEGIADTRGTLFHNIAEILETKQPQFAVLENVRGLISHDRGRTLQIILKKLVAMGYRCNIPNEVILGNKVRVLQEHAKRMVLKSIDFGVPQNRQRIFIVLWREGSIDFFNYPEPLDVSVKVGDILEPNPDPNLTISDRLWAGHQRRKRENKLAGKGFGYGMVTPSSDYTNTISARYYKDGSEILIDQSHIDPKLNPRKLSPREAARLQGFPEEFQLAQSNVQAYKQFGNSVTVPVVEALARQLVALL